MKNVTRFLLAVGLGLTLFSAVGSADPSKGGKIIDKLLMRSGGCPIPASRVAMAHSVAEWAKIYKEGKMEEEIQKLCHKKEPLPKITNKKYAKDVYDYLSTYAYDSGGVPA
ncbi:hypothetical protein [Nitratifractor salsuginis]|uniref:Cytochrome c family protein n=1 Tax=Nitratifractor salsuginis (strain DSM 16511 / JCM 12458 / E9I37-1) TaxID=749222 RepID=E6X1L4_NITSE|nr:hypothetical protein [Nitratifractor salsuginis]ADV47005.1 hypothetical protein Nitsa_1759 [Nitratifractor salsuginis DSM 16511]